MGAHPKYYVVWEGRDTGIFDSWDDCRDLVEGYPGARYKAFKSLEEASAAYRRGADSGMNLFKAMAGRFNAGDLDGQETPAEAAPTVDIPKPTPRPAAPALPWLAHPGVRRDAIAVDAACSGNPGPMEYRCMRIADGKELFHMGPLDDGTNNIGEYLGIIHAAAALFNAGDTATPIYTDSRTALSWVRRRGSRTQLQATARNDRIFQLLARADRWIQTHTIANPLLKWDTSAWGEIPADFNRK